MERHEINVQFVIDQDEYVKNVMINVKLVSKATYVEYSSF